MDMDMDMDRYAYESILSKNVAEGMANPGQGEEARAMMRR